MRKSIKIFSFLTVFVLTAGISPGRPGSHETIPVVAYNGRKYVSLFSLIQQLEVENSFDIITQRGKFYRGTRTSIYQVGLSIQMLNGRLKKYSYPVIRKQGEVLFPEEFCRDMMKGLYPKVTIRQEKKRLIIIKPDTMKTPARDVDRPPQVMPIVPGKYTDRISFIIIDPGHGGKDPGAIGKGRIKEKWITLDMAKKLERELKKKVKNIKVILTRKKDRFLELSKRTEIANSYLRKHSNGLFISLHVNASISSRISGFETYFLSQNPSNEDARTTAALENNVIVLENRGTAHYNDVEHMEAFMFMTQIQKESALLAKSIQREMDKKIWEFKSRNVKKADFYVLRGVLMPAALIEIGYITNRKEASYLKKSRYKDKVASGICNGIIQFIKKYNALVKNK